jgi:hypothetical protein
MAALRRVIAIPVVAFYGIFGIAVFMMPWALLLCSSKSPLRVRDASYIDGFVMGVSFMFFMLLGAGFFAGAVVVYRRRVKDGRTAP